MLIDVALNINYAPLAFEFGGDDDDGIAYGSQTLSLIFSQNIWFMFWMWQVKQA